MVNAHPGASAIEAQIQALQHLATEAAKVIDELVAAAEMSERPSQAVLRQAAALLPHLKGRPPAPQPADLEPPSRNPSHGSPTPSQAERTASAIAREVPFPILTAMAPHDSGAELTRAWLGSAFAYLKNADGPAAIEESLRNAGLQGRPAARAWTRLHDHLRQVHDVVSGTCAPPLGFLNQEVADLGRKHFGGDAPPSAWFHAVAVMSSYPGWLDASGLALAGVGRSAFGNPIPQAWYGAINDLRARSTFFMAVNAQPEAMAQPQEGTDTATPHKRPRP
ncbi:MAG: hypothetical protein O9327_05900 [Polaromonas sp.]|nr:hypothetical protein [Polaromonas sp.]